MAIRVISSIEVVSSLFVISLLTGKRTDSCRRKRSICPAFIKVWVWVS